MNNMNWAWLHAVSNTLAWGQLVSPRGKATKETLHRTITVDMNRPVLTVEARKLSYRFMAAEAFWILTGDDRVESIAPYNKAIADFSDDGKTFFGAYGPKVVQQMPYVIRKLYEDPDTRQAGLTIWRESPPTTKDVPCTVAMFFNIRGGRLNASVFMRSSDVWLGVPYDVFNFSMIAHFICGSLNQSGRLVGLGGGLLEPGTLYLTAISSHLYETNWSGAQSCLSDGFKIDLDPGSMGATPSKLWQDPGALMDTLAELRDSKPGDACRWWELRS